MKKLSAVLLLCIAALTLAATVAPSGSFDTGLPDDVGPCSSDQPWYTCGTIPDLLIATAAMGLSVVVTLTLSYATRRGDVQ